MTFLLPTLLLLACDAEPEVLSAPLPAPTAHTAPITASTPTATGPELPEALPPDAFTDLTDEERRYIEGNWKLLSTMRDVRLKPGETLEKMAITPGMSVVDLGAGTGYFAFRFSELVGPGGRVYATDIASGALKYMGAIIERETESGRDFGNITLVENPLEGTGVADGSADVVFVCSIHIFSHLNMLHLSDEDRATGDPVALMAASRGALIQSIFDTLKPGGRFVYMEGRLGSHDGLDLGPDAISALFSRSGFTEAGRHDHLEKMDMLVMEKPL
ncbi:MAG: SAM-dependent methyltransferase [Myxococcota bacterium]|jgi:SAM-dependent methyltransferase